MSQMSMSAVETGSAVVWSANSPYCRRVGGIVIAQRLHGRLALSLCKSRQKIFEALHFRNFGIGVDDKTFLL